MFDYYDTKCGQQHLEWIELANRYYNEYLDDCECVDADECNCLSFIMFEDKLLREMEEAQ